MYKLKNCTFVNCQDTWYVVSAIANDSNKRTLKYE